MVLVVILFYFWFLFLISGYKSAVDSWYRVVLYYRYAAVCPIGASSLTKAQNQWHHSQWQPSVQIEPALSHRHSSARLLHHPQAIHTCCPYPSACSISLRVRAHLTNSNCPEISVSSSSKKKRAKNRAQICPTHIGIRDQETASAFHRRIRMDR